MTKQHVREINRIMELSGVITEVDDDLLPPSKSQPVYPPGYVPGQMPAPDQSSTPGVKPGVKPWAGQTQQQNTQLPMGGNQPGSSLSIDQNGMIYVNGQPIINISGMNMPPGTQIVLDQSGLISVGGIPVVNINDVSRGGVSVSVNGQQINTGNMNGVNMINTGTSPLCPDCGKPLYENYCLECEMPMAESCCMECGGQLDEGVCMECGAGAMPMYEDMAMDNDFGHKSLEKNGTVNPAIASMPGHKPEQDIGHFGVDNTIAFEATEKFEKLTEAYAAYLIEADDAVNADGMASPLTANNRNDFVFDPFADKDPKTDGSMSPLSSIARESFLKKQQAGK